MWPSCGWAGCGCHPAGSWVPRTVGAERRGGCRGGEWCAQSFGEHHGCLARLLGDGAGIRLKVVGCPALSRQAEKKLPGSSWHRGRKKEESIWGEREGKKDLRLKKKKKKATLSKFMALHYEPSLLWKTSLKEFFITAVQQWFHC